MTYIISTPVSSLLIFGNTQPAYFALPKVGSAYPAGPSAPKKPQRKRMQRLRRFPENGFLPKWWIVNILRLVFALFVLLSLPLFAQAQTLPEVAVPALIDNMDGQAPVLRPLSRTSGFSITQRSIDRARFQHGRGAEKILLTGPAGRAIPLAYSLQPIPVIQELHFRASVLSNRVGVQLAAQVVLPRTMNHETGRPFELLVRSTEFGSGSQWEEVSLDQLPQLVANHARVARVKYGQVIDERGAYVSHLVLLAPGGGGGTEVSVDRIQVFGMTNNHRNIVGIKRPNTAETTKTKGEARPPANKFSSAAIATERGHSIPRIPRVIQWQGESFEALQKLGFNTVGMSRLPSAEQLAQAELLGLSIVCPPPTQQQLNLHGIGNEYDPVLAWDLGEPFSPDDLAETNRWEQLVSRYDRLDSRQTVLTPQSNSLEASRIADSLLIGRATVGTRLTVREHAAWLAQRQRLARPGTPIWTMIETQLSPQQQLQVSSLSSNIVDVQGVSYGQLTSLTSAGLGVKARGFYFQSQSSLIGKSLASQQRALALELTNMRLQLAEPWLATGKEIFAARSSRPELSGLVMQAERSHLLVPVWWSGDFQAASPPRASGPVSFVVPGVAESSEAYLVTLGGIQSVRHRRVTGGIRLTLDELPYDSFVLFSDDPQAISQVTRYVRRISSRAAQIRRELVKLRLQAITEVLASLHDSARMGSQPSLQKAQSYLATCDRQLSSRNFELAYLRADAVELAVEQIENDLQMSYDSSGNGSMLNCGPISLADQLRLSRMLARAPLGANLLTSGGFESLPSLLNSGWQHKQFLLDGITSSVRLSPESPHSGSYCLELEARSVDEQTPTAIVPAAPVWVASSPLEVQVGDFVEITGVARLAAPLIGTVDGLQIMDSLGGPDMALRIHEAPSWQPFRLVRVATSNTPVSVTIALSGLGKAQVDDVAVRVIRK